MAKFKIKGRTQGKVIVVDCDYDSFLSQFYGCDEQPERDQNGVYIVDDESIEATLRDYPEVVSGRWTENTKTFVILTTSQSSATETIELEGDPLATEIDNEDLNAWIREFAQDNGVTESSVRYEVK